VKTDRATHMAAMKLNLSIIIPVLDEEENLRELARELAAALSGLGGWECIFVDDGSTDGSRAVMRDIAEGDERFQYLALDRHYGQSTAFMAGFRAAGAPLLATMDGDRQNDPADLPGLLAPILAGDVDMVNGVRTNRQDRFVKLASSKIANGVRNWLTNDRVTDVGCSLRAFRRECLEAIPAFEGMHRFLPTLVRMGGWRIAELPVRHRPRTAGRSKYGIFNRLLKALRDAFAVRWIEKRGIRYRIAARSKRLETPSRKKGT